MIQLVDTSRLKPAAYNPREADAARLDLVELSLRKLGWLLPVYAAETDDGLEILSGHQRHMVATERLGYVAIPVQLVAMKDVHDRRLVNIAFNRGTNDFTASDTSKTISAELARSNVMFLASRLPDIVPGGPDAYPCMDQKTRPISDFLESCSGRWSDHASRVNKLLAARGVSMPVVVSGNRVVNGVGRIQQVAEFRKGTEVETIEISPERADMAFAMMNLLSMDFAIHKRYADLMRFSNGRRLRSLNQLNKGMIYAMEETGSRQFDHTDPKVRAKWLAYYGPKVFDFGAGSGVDSRIMRSMGADVTSFEPWAYHAYGDEGGSRLGGSAQEELDFDVEESRRRVRLVLERVADGTRWDSIFMASVLNSVPFDADRRHLIVLIAALASEDTRVYPVAANYKNPGTLHVTGGDYVNDFAAELTHFALDYEPRTTMTSFDRAAKTQRFFTGGEFYDLWAERFTKVRVRNLKSLVCGWVKGPRPLPWERLEEAIRFEFDLPFPDGVRLGLVDEALAAFEKRRCTRLA